MEELKKVVRVMGKLDPLAPHEVMLVLDAGTGQNALSQAEHFQQWVGVTGIALTKLDGTAKVGIIFAIAKKLGINIVMVTHDIDEAVLMADRALVMAGSPGKIVHDLTIELEDPRDREDEAVQQYRKELMAIFEEASLPTRQSVMV